MRIEINVPENLSEITLGQYLKFEKLNTKENENSIFLLQKMVEIFCNLDLNMNKLVYVLSMPRCRFLE